MIQHYLKIAFRNLWKYKTQSLITIIGLAVGFTCFALASLWIQYEMSYDSFHKNSDRMYQVYVIDGQKGPDDPYRTSSSPYPLAEYLKESFPEVEAATTVSSDYFEGYPSYISLNDEDSRTIWEMGVTPSFMEMFEVNLSEGNRDFLIPGSKNIAITDKKAKLLFGSESPLGKTLSLDGESFTITAVVEAWSPHTNYRFDILYAITPVMDWMRNWETIIKLKPHTNVKAFEKKLYDTEMGVTRNRYIGTTLLPLSSVQYKDANREMKIQFHYLFFIAIAGVFVILCAFSNYITLFICRFEIRKKEMALRIVCGSSRKSLFLMLAIELMLTLLLALFVCFLCIMLVSGSFKELSGTEFELMDIYKKSLLYIGITICLVLPIPFLMISAFRRKTLQKSFQKEKKHIYRNISIVVQLVISMGFIFCTTVMAKQIYYLHNDSLGFDYKNSIYIHCDKERGKALAERIAQLPEAHEILNGETVLMPVESRTIHGYSNWEDKREEDTSVSIEIIYTKEDYFDFYNLRLIEGEFLTKDDPEHTVMINEATAKSFGWKNAVGKKIYGGNELTVKGVLKDFYTKNSLSPNVPCCKY